jgi:hypothetical protein
MQRTEPNYSVEDLADVLVPVAIVQGEHDKCIKLEHAECLARSIPGAEFMLLPGVSHFVPLQRPEKFNSVMLAFLDQLLFRKERPSARLETAGRYLLGLDPGSAPQTGVFSLFARARSSAIRSISALALG